MHLDTSAVERNRFDLDADDLLLLQLLEYATQNTAFGPAVHASVDGVPVAKTLRQSTPLAAMLCDIEYGVENLHVTQADIATLAWQTVLNLLVLGFDDFHRQSISNFYPLVLTGPKSEVIRQLLQMYCLFIFGATDGRRPARVLIQALDVALPLCCWEWASNFSLTLLLHEVARVSFGLRGA